MYQSRNWKPVPYTREEKESMAEAAKLDEWTEEDEAKLKAEAILSWIASNGAAVEVHSGSRKGFYSVRVNGEWHEDCVLVPAPEKYQAVGIVVKLGPIGLTAERKAIIEK